MGSSNETQGARTDMRTAEARAAVGGLKDALARAERRHRECWDETERISGLRERLCDLKREDRARQIAGLQLDVEGAKAAIGAGAICGSEAEEGTAVEPPCAEPCACPRSTTCRELRRRIAYLKGAVTQTDLQAAFLDLYSAELEVDKARAELLGLLGSLPEGTIREIGEQVPTQSDFDELPNAWGIAAVENHLRKTGADEEPDPVDQLNYRRWLVELSQGALGYSRRLEHEMARHRTELKALEQQAANVDFFEKDELEQIAQAVALQRARIAACQEQLAELAPAAGALDKRMEACEAELQRFLDREG